MSIAITRAFALEVAEAGRLLLAYLRRHVEEPGAPDPTRVEYILNRLSRPPQEVLAIPGLQDALPAHRLLVEGALRVLELAPRARAEEERVGAALRAEAGPGEEGARALDVVLREAQFQARLALGAALLDELYHRRVGDFDALEGRRAAEARWLLEQAPPATPGEQNEAASAKPASEGDRRPCFSRDNVWLRWAEEERMRPSAIRDRWNRQHPKEHVGAGKGGLDRVRKGLKAARRDRENS